MRKVRLVFLTFFFFFLIFFSPRPRLIWAQEDVNLNTANTYEIANPAEVEDGDLIVIVEESGELKLAQSGQLGQIFGVVAKNSPIVYRTSGTGVPIVRGGEVVVNVTNLGGPIKIGDLVAPSSVAGKAQKASEADVQVVGLALESFDGRENTGQIRVALRIGSGFEQGSEFKRVASLYLEELGLSAFDIFTGEEQVGNVARYGVAAVVVLASLFFSFKFFGRQVIQGLNSMGRNPLASRKIQTMIVFNVVLIAAVNIGAIILALFIVRF